MKWLFGIAAVMIVAHLYFKWGRWRIKRDQQVRSGQVRIGNGGPPDPPR
jgi:hypothetical protein